MKCATSPIRSVGLGLALAALLVSASFGQGDLLPPPGPPGPTMKSLDQIGPGVIVDAIHAPGDATNTFIIRAPGSYYFAGNITGDPGKNGISIQANDVTLDLNGFALIGGGGPGGGVTVEGARTNFCIRQGSVQSWGGGGVRAEQAVTRAEKLRLANNAGGIGLWVEGGSTVADCVASGNATGFFGGSGAQFTRCIATVNTEDGFHSWGAVTIMDSTSSRNGRVGIWVEVDGTILRCNVSRNESDGIVANGGSTVADCTSSNNGSRGIYVASHGTVRDCTAQGNRGPGVSASENCLVVGTSCDLNGSGGITTFGGGNRIEGNQCTSNGGIGFDISANSLLVGNSAHANTRENFVLQLGAAAGPIVNLSAGGTIVSDSATANFEH